MRGSTKTTTVQKMVDVEEIEIILNMTEAQANILRSLLGSMGPKEVEGIINNPSIYTETYSADQTMELVYELYNALYDVTKPTI